MNRRDFIRSSLTGAALAAWPRSLWAVADARRRQPNIILILTDDMGWEAIGAHGETPALDTMASQGMRFEHCYCQPLCTPSRLQLLTGQYNIRNYTRFGVMDRGQTTFAQLLKKAGYATAIGGKWQLGTEPDSPQHFGFDESLLWHHTDRGNRYANPALARNGKTVPTQPGTYGPDLTCAFLCDFMDRNRDKPFLAYYPMELTHAPFQPTPDSPGWGKANAGGMSKEDLVKYMVEYSDKLVGRLVAQVKALGLEQDTLILFTGDNGAQFSSQFRGKTWVGAKGKGNDHGTHAPLIASWPGTMPAGRLCTDLVDFSDFLPTICEAVGAVIPRDLTIDGRSFLPQLRGQAGTPRTWVYCWYSRDGGPTPKVEWARNQRFRLTRDGTLTEVDVDTGEDLPAKASMEEQAKVRQLLQTALDRYRNARPPAVAAQRGKGETE
jgi:arylsulfatase A